MVVLQLDIIQNVFGAVSDRCPLCQLLFRIDHFIRTVAQQELGLYISLCTRDHKLCAQLLEQRCCFQRTLKIAADGYDTHIKITNTKGAQKVFAGAVTDLCIRHIGKHSVHTVLIAVDRHDLMTQFIQFLRNMAAKTAKPDQKNRFHTCLLYPIAIFSCGRREWAGLLPNAA